MTAMVGPLAVKECVGPSAHVDLRCRQQTHIRDRPGPRVSVSGRDGQCLSVYTHPAATLAEGERSLPSLLRSVGETATDTRIRDRKHEQNIVYLS